MEFSWKCSYIALRKWVWNFTLVFSKLDASGRYLRGMDPGWVAEYLQLSQSLQVPWLVLQALGLPFMLSTLNLFMCYSSGKAYIKLIWSSIIEWYTFVLILVWYTAFPSILRNWLVAGSFPRFKKKGEGIWCFFSLSLASDENTPALLIGHFTVRFLSIFPNYPYLKEDCLEHFSNK